MKTMVAVGLIVLGLVSIQIIRAESKDNPSSKKHSEHLAKATLAGGCFWCVEALLEKVDGVVEATSGYMGGPEKNPQYKQVAAGRTGHAEVVEVLYDPQVISYSELLDHFWMSIDPTTRNRQFADVGSQYRTAIFYHNEKQRELAEASRKKYDEAGYFPKPIVTEIVPASDFYKAEEYHQDYYKKNPRHYKSYYYGSGRGPYLEKLWGKDRKKMMTKKTKTYDTLSKQELKKALTPLQFHVTQEDGTERPFNNEYWDNKREGIYVDIVSGEPLFSSIDKFKSGTGWPSFTRPLEPDHIVEKIDTKLFMKRVEVRSRHADSHLGHVFDDGPQPTGLRYCINSASLRFIPKEDLVKEGYEQYVDLFSEG